MKKNPYKIKGYRTHVHIYSGQLIFGDAYKIINELSQFDPNKPDHINQHDYY